ncbi:MAG: hypothetical protein HQL76_15135 [Magnetococcales bacterium]|nr:hypothetical protein [Magnetococcales bacterium]
MIASMPGLAGRMYCDELDLLLSLQEIGKESGWDCLSQQMEVSETLVRMTRGHLGTVVRETAPHKAMKTLGLASVDMGRTLFKHAVATTEIVRDAERQAMDLLIGYMALCLKGEDIANGARLSDGGRGVH